MKSAPPVNVLSDLEKSHTEDFSEKVQMIVHKLEKEAELRVSQKQGIENRWISESYQYEGQYSSEEYHLITDTDTMNKSSVYMNMTRQKTNAMEARLVDGAGLAGGGFDLQPSPVPELKDEAAAWAKFAAENQQQLLEIPDGDPAMQDAVVAQREAIARATTLQSTLDEARRRAELMHDEVADQLKACNYANMENLIKHDACKLGTGIMKGPVLGGKTRKSWSSSVDPESGFDVYEMVEVTDQKPMFYRVDPWNWFPDMDAATIDESSSFFERHLMTESDLRKLAKMDGFIVKSIKKLLKAKARTSAPQYLNDLRTMVGNDYVGYTDKYHVWEYHGVLDYEDFRCLSEYSEDYDARDEPDEDDIDPLFEQQVTVWFCDGELLKFGIHPLDSLENIYSVFNFERDDHSIFGFGVPHLIADSQKVLCAAWRMMIDNAALATVPQIVFTHTVEPQDGDYLVYPGKKWVKKSGGVPGERPFETYHFDIRQGELQRIVEMAIRSIEQESGIPLMAQAEPGAMPTQTALGISVLNRSMNVIFGLLIKQFEETITIPCIRRLYDWNMQFSQKEHLKGDMEVSARGASTYTLREIQAPNLMSLLLQFTSHPVLGPAMLVMPMMRKLARALMLEPSEVVKTDEKLAADLAAAAQAEGPPPPTPDEIRLQIAQMTAENAKYIAELDSETRKYVATKNHEQKMMDLKMSGNLAIQEREARAANEQAKLDSKERVVAADAAIAERTGQRSGGTF